jgi:hypothetical protein
MKRNYVLVILAFVLLAGLSLENKAQNTKSPLKILFVGYDAHRIPREFRKGLDDFTAKDSVRMPAYQQLLSAYFAEVKTMDCRDWKQGDSDPYDVTIFDYPTTPIEKGSNEKGNYITNRYLPDSYSKPTVFIGSTADIMGRRIGLKLDWLCLCLDADAHHLNTRHAIFNGPLEKVVPTMVMKKTPDNIYEYPSGDTIPVQIPMWKVQTVSYGKGDKVRIGMVSRGERFMDSPDVEAISSGVCIKSVTAVALGRHGNFFLWGFAASPDIMTAEAKKVFVNAVAYIKKFDGQAPIARKYNDRMATTDDIRMIAGMATKESWKKAVASYEESNKMMLEGKKKVETKVAAGETLTDEEKMYLNVRPSPIPGWEEYLENISGPYYKQFGTDVDAYRKFMKENIDFMYCDPKAFFTYTVDEDVKKIDVPNHSLKLLETCIAMLKKDQDTELALRVLKRYTPVDFGSAKEWESWYKANKDRLFFTEPGGYKFLVNSYKQQD